MQFLCTCGQQWNPAEAPYNWNQGSNPCHVSLPPLVPSVAVHTASESSSAFREREIRKIASSLSFSMSRAPPSAIQNLTRARKALRTEVMSCLTSIRELVKSALLVQALKDKLVGVGLHRPLTNTATAPVRFFIQLTPCSLIATNTKRNRNISVSSRLFRCTVVPR